MTRSQLKLLTFLCQRMASGVTPSYDEMRLHMGLASKSGIHRILGRLQQSGYIRRRVGAVREIEVVYLPPIIDGQCPCCGQDMPKAEAA